MSHAIKRASLFVYRCFTLRSVALALWVDAYEHHKGTPMSTQTMERPTDQAGLEPQGTPMSTQTMERPTDQAGLERSISHKSREALQRYQAGDRDGARRSYSQMAALVAQRSPAIVRRMELERGLA